MGFDKNKYKVWRLPHLALVHWILNPGLAFNELVLGQRVPKITLIDTTSDAPLVERQYVPCPHCGTIHHGSLWAKKAAFKNWFGLLCPECDQIIPCLWNLTSLVLLTITFPIWGWFRRSLEIRWRHLKKGTHEDSKPTAVKDVAWLKMGLIYGAFMFCVMALPKILGGNVTTKYLITQIIVWFVAGLVFSGITKLILGRKKNK